jgi:mono/diheme cytochrome c family protein
MMRRNQFHAVHCCLFRAIPPARRGALRIMIVTASAAAFAFTWAQSAPTVSEGVYSASQAGRGAALYAKDCASCHGDKLEGRAQAPPLAGAEFTSNWSGQTLGDLFDKIQTSMPADRPGRLEPGQNAAIVAYILSANKFPAGKDDLPADAERLRNIRFEASK